MKERKETLNVESRRDLEKEAGRKYVWQKADHLALTN
jgi:hypothetical protein